MSVPSWLSDWQARAGTRWWWPIACVLLLAAGVVIWSAVRSGASQSPAPVAGAAEFGHATATPPAPGAVPSAPPASEPAPAARDAGAPLSATVKIVFRTFPGRRASVMWGGKRLGFIDRNAPLVVERPRDSGPLDVVIRAQDYVPVHTRAYTFNDSNIDVKLTQLDKKDTLYGFKQPIPPDAGVPFPADAPEIPE